MLLLYNKYELIANFTKILSDLLDVRKIKCERLKLRFFFILDSMLYLEMKKQKKMQEDQVRSFKILNSCYF